MAEDLNQTVPDAPKPDVQPAAKPPEPQSELKEDQVKVLLEKSEISLLLDSYDDIFSDFDPRPFSQRALSDDFLQEAKRASRDKVSGTIQLRFLIPAAARKPETEAIIRKRLRDHFKKHFLEFEKDSAEKRKSGMIYSVIGLMLMASAAFISYYDDGRLYLRMVNVVLEPAGWFTVWYGLDKVFYTSKDKAPDLEFYRKMSKAEVLFDAY